MQKTENSFRTRVYEMVSQIPKGKVMSYGDVASYCGSPFAARQVGQIAHFGPPDLPWQRVVNHRGGLASAYSFGGLEGHKAALKSDGLQINEQFAVMDFEAKRWRPN